MAALDARYIFVAKEDSHKHMFRTARKSGMSELSKTTKLGKGVRLHRHILFANDVPLNGKKPAPGMNGSDGATKTNLVIMAETWTNPSGIQLLDKEGNPRNRTRSFITNIAIDSENAEKIADHGTSRWEIENRLFNNLKNRGHNLGHKYAHGKLTMQSMCSSMIVLSFAIQTAAKLMIRRFRESVDRYGKGKLDIQRMVLLVAGILSRYMEVCQSYFPGWTELMGRIIGESRRRLEEKGLKNEDATVEPSIQGHS
jgi:hypothetical protein